jgi:hypothetical protein
MSLLTFQDALDQLQLYVAGTQMTRAKGDMRHAIHAALQAVYQERSWTYYQSAWSFSSRAGMTTGTVGYSHAGLVLTITGNTWPTWADRGTVLANDLYGDIDRATTYSAYVDPNFNFGQTISDGTTYTLFQDKFTLPELFQNLGVAVTASDGTLLRYITPEEYVYRRSFGQEIGYPTEYTILNDPDVIGRYAMALYPSPDEIRTYYVKFMRAYRELKLTGDDTSSQQGTVTIGNGSKYVTGTSTAFNSVAHKNAILRVGDTLNVPTGIRGLHPWIEQFQIAHVAASSGSEALILRSTAGQAFTTAKYVITDPVDIPAELEQAFLKRCRVELCECRPETKKSEEWGRAMKAYEDALHLATRHDSKDDTPKVFGGFTGTPYGIPERPLEAEDD